MRKPNVPSGCLRRMPSLHPYWHAPARHLTRRPKCGYAPHRSPTRKAPTKVTHAVNTITGRPSGATDAAPRTPPLHLPPHHLTTIASSLRPRSLSPTHCPTPPHPPALTPQDPPQATLSPSSAPVSCTLSARPCSNLPISLRVKGGSAGANPPRRGRATVSMAPQSPQRSAHATRRNAHAAYMHSVPPAGQGQAEHRAPAAPIRAPYPTHV